MLRVQLDFLWPTLLNHCVLWAFALEKECEQIELECLLLWNLFLYFLMHSGTDISINADRICELGLRKDNCWKYNVEFIYSVIVAITIDSFVFSFGNILLIPDLGSFSQVDAYNVCNISGNNLQSGTFRTKR